MELCHLCQRNMIFAGSFMQALINRVLIACGLAAGNAEWTQGGLWSGENFAGTLRRAILTYAGLPKWVKPTEPFYFRYDDLTKEDYEKAATLTLYRVERNGKLIHISRTREAALREIGWRDWELGRDGVAIVEMKRKGLTIYGATRNPHRYGSPWPKAKLEEFARLYHSDIPMRELEEYFDTASSLLGRKRAELGLRKRSGG